MAKIYTRRHLNEKETINRRNYCFNRLAVFLISRFGGKQEQGVLTVSGNVEVTEVNMGFKTSGRVVELLVEEGQKVKKGDKLTILDSAEVESQVAQHMAYLNETITRLQELKAGSRPQEIEQVTANVKYAEAELIKAKKDHERAEVLYKNGAISAQQMDTAKKVYDTVTSQHKKALEALSLVKEGPRKEEIRAAENRVRQAEAAYAPRRAAEIVKRTDIVKSVSVYGDRLHIAIAEMGLATEVIDRLRDEEIDVRDYRRILPSVEDIFISKIAFLESKEGAKN